MYVYLRFLYIAAIITFIYAMQYFIQVYGEKHYEKEDGTVFDPVHENTPDFFRYGWITNVIPVILLLYMPAERRSPPGSDHSSILDLN